jgi:hypothetical protein
MMAQLREDSQGAAILALSVCCSVWGARAAARGRAAVGQIECPEPHVRAPLHVHYAVSLIM